LEHRVRPRRLRDGRRATPPNDAIHHSDQGSQYTSIAFGQRCRVAGVWPSMGSGGDCFDNALCETFFAPLECELLDREPFPPRAAARLASFFASRRSVSVRCPGSTRISDAAATRRPQGRMLQYDGSS
jgi:transposase InsO family protein